MITSSDDKLQLCVSVVSFFICLYTSLHLRVNISAYNKMHYSALSHLLDVYMLLVNAK